MLRLFVLSALQFALAASAQQGVCVSGDCRTGDGVLETSRGTVYSGRFENGRLTGPVRIAYSDGDTLDVPFRNGQSSGTGVHRYADGRVFEGLYASGDRNGLGTLTELDGSVHRATWDGGVRRGVGRVTYPNGDLFVGWWGGSTYLGGDRDEYRTRSWLYRWAESGSRWIGTYNEGFPEPGIYSVGSDSVGVGLLDRAWDGVSPVPPPDTLVVADVAGVIRSVLRSDGMRRANSTYVSQFVIDVPAPERFHVARLSVTAEADDFAPMVEWVDARGDTVLPEDGVLETALGGTWVVRVTSATSGATGPFVLRWSAPVVRR